MFYYCTFPFEQFEVFFLHTNIAEPKMGVPRKRWAYVHTWSDRDGKTSAWVSSHIHLRARLLFNKCALLFITYDSK